ncbi:hypothetical protein OG589_24940 [Sphaerisporangium sp. NBC_01403]|uniref:hypothetical protein n=1 Tax=Sphaerisporangium sp. NBC_01403 TaxID=2903599 RepID=UPI003252DB57
MAEFLICCLLLAPLVFLVLAVRLALRVVRAVRRGRPPTPAQALSPKPLLELAAMSFLGTALCWAAGIGSGFYILDPDQMCGMAAGRAFSAFRTIETQASFPVRQICRWTDGSGYDLVPAWVNPAIALFFAAFLASLLACLAGLILRRRQVLR